MMKVDDSDWVGAERSKSVRVVGQRLDVKVEEAPQPQASVAAQDDSDDAQGVSDNEIPNTPEPSPRSSVAHMDTEEDTEGNDPDVETPPRPAPSASRSSTVMHVENVHEGPTSVRPL